MPSPVRIRPLIVASWSPGYEPVKARQHWLRLIPPPLGRPSEAKLCSRNLLPNLLLDGEIKSKDRATKKTARNDVSSRDPLITTSSFLHYSNTRSNGSDLSPARYVAGGRSFAFAAKMRRRENVFCDTCRFRKCWLSAKQMLLSLLHFHLTNTCNYQYPHICNIIYKTFSTHIDLQH